MLLLLLLAGRRCGLRGLVSGCPFRHIGKGLQRQHGLGAAAIVDDHLQIRQELKELLEKIVG